MRQLTTSSSPHIRSRWIASTIMRDVLISLIPVVISACVIHGIRAILLIMAGIVSCIITESFCTGKAGINGSEVITGLLLALSLPASVPWWIPVAGGVFSILVVKHLCGGLGKNVFNPVLAARAFLLLVWPVHLTIYPAMGMDGMTAATPLHAMQIPALPESSLTDMFLGTIGGCIGETSVLAILLGAAYLLKRRVIRLHIPLAYLGTVAVLTLAFSGEEPPVQWMMYHLLSGSLLLGAVYMATDYVTSPVTPKGRIAFGIGCGVLTVILRSYGLYPEGVTYAILCMNPFAWALDRVFAPRVFGHEKGGRSREKRG